MAAATCSPPAERASRRTLWARPIEHALTITLGDYIDRGPDARGVLDLLIGWPEQANLVALRGNHEQMLDFMQDPGGLQTWRLADVAAGRRNRNLAFLRRGAEGRHARAWICGGPRRFAGATARRAFGFPAAHRAQLFYRGLFFLPRRRPRRCSARPAGCAGPAVDPRRVPDATASRC